MATKIIFTDEQKKDIIRMYENELIGRKEIAKVFFCSPNTIYRLLKKENIIMSFSERLPKLIKAGRLPNYCKNISEKNKGKHYSPETEFKKGNKPWSAGTKGVLKAWNKNLTKETDERVKKYALGVSENAKINPNFGMRGKHNSEDKRKKISESLLKTFEIMKKNGTLNWQNLDGLKEYYKTHDVWNIGLTKDTNEKVKKISEDINRRRGISAAHQEIPLEKWNKFTSFEPYTQEFNKAFKLAIKQRDGFLCLKCGMREEDAKILFKRGLAIHHIDYIKENTFKENCCALCVRCNFEVNSNRKSWTKFFQSLLAERYGYEYTEDGKIILELNNLEDK